MWTRLFKSPFVTWAGTPDPCQSGHPLTAPSMFSKSFEKSSRVLSQVLQSSVDLAFDHLTSFLSPTDA